MFLVIMCFSNIMNYDPDIQQSAVVKIFPSRSEAIVSQMAMVVHAFYFMQSSFRGGCSIEISKMFFHEKIGGFKKPSISSFGGH